MWKNVIFRSFRLCADDAQRCLRKQIVQEVIIFEEQTKHAPHPGLIRIPFVIDLQNIIINET